MPAKKQKKTAKKAQSKEENTKMVAVDCLKKANAKQSWLVYVEGDDGIHCVSASSEAFRAAVLSDMLERHLKTAMSDLSGVF